MITVKCIEKFINNSGIIIGYRLQDINGQTQDTASDNLKNAIRNKQIHVVNLTLTKDNRLVDCNEKQLPSRALGKQLPQDDIYVKCAKAMVYIDKSLLDMGDSLRGIVEAVNTAAGIDINVFSLSEKQLDNAFIKAYIKLAKEEPSTIAQYFGYRFEYGDDETIERNMQYEHVSDSRQSETYKSLANILTYLKYTKQSQELISNTEDLLRRIEQQNASTVDIAYKASHEYFRHLDKELFGLITNDFRTVGHKITSSEIKKFKVLKGYEYICHKDLSVVDAPRFTIAMMFKSSGNEVKVDFKFARQGYISEHSVDTVGYFMNVASIDLLRTDSVEELGKKLASVCNKIAPKMWEMVKQNPELSKYEPLK